MQNQLKFNLDVPLAASNVAVRYHKPNPIVVERAGGLTNIPVHHHMPAESRDARRASQASITEDRMALAVRLAKRDLKKQRDQPDGNRTPSPKPYKSRVTKGGTRVVYTKEAQERGMRLQKKQQVSRDVLKVREQGWNAGVIAGRSRTPPRNNQADFPATTNSPPTRDTDRYPVNRGIPSDDPDVEIMRLQREMEGYLQQIQVIEQRAMQEQSSGVSQPPKSRKREGYLAEEEDPSRRAMRMEEQTTRSARQVYNLRQQVRALQDQVRNRGNVKHTKKSQVMLRLAAAHRGAVRAIQGFVSQQLPQQDLSRGLPAGYQELSQLIRQLANLSTQIRTEKDTTSVHEDLVKMLDRVDELNKAWSEEAAALESVEERRRKSPQGRQPAFEVGPDRGRQPAMQGRQFGMQGRQAGKENRPKGLLKKQFIKGKVHQKQRQQRKVTPERQQVLKAGLEALMRGNQVGNRSRPGVAWDVSADDSALSEPANTSLILPKGLQYKRDRAQKSVLLAVPESHFADPTLSSCQKATQPADLHYSREPWKPGGSGHQSPGRARSKDRSRSRDRSRSKHRVASLERSRSQQRVASLDRSRSYSPKSRHRGCLIQDMDTELMQELFPEGVDGQGSRVRSASPRSRSQRQRSISPPRSPGTRSRFDAHKMTARLGRLQRKTQDASMVHSREREMAEINLRRALAGQHAEGNGEMLTDMILNDILHDTASELESLEGDDHTHRHASALVNNPTMENMYQRLEQMELEQMDIRRRWGTLQFEEESSSRLKARKVERPSGPMAFEITRHGPAQSHRVQSGRAYDKDTDAPIIFTKSAPPVAYQQRNIPLETDEDSIFYHSAALPHHRTQYKTKLKLPEASIKEIHNNLEKYERHLKKSSHQKAGRFDPWKLVEEVSDQILTECLKEIENELDGINENIVHQVCRAEFAVPESSSFPQSPAQEVQDVARDDGIEENIKPDYRLAQTSPEQEQEVELVSNFRKSTERSLIQSRKDDSEVRTSDKFSKKEVSFDHEVTYDQESVEDSYESERGAVFDAADLDIAASERDGPESLRNVEEQYQDDYEEDDDEDDDDDVEEVSPIDSDELEYSTDEA
ncbi:protein moonraker-like isoform X2 [Mya arenaria]|uniref:protein moonraker-like isoform X2 n=1 Tax=Mya arenaria TaxID=6604 RepID=UPI0022E18FDF|nr:protein moonraker-like isoform X2 [Mya arenaria]